MLDSKLDSIRDRKLSHFLSAVGIFLYLNIYYSYVYLPLFLIVMFIPDIFEYMSQSKNKNVALVLYQFRSLYLLSNSHCKLLIPNC